jgi:hypothetical protein
MRAIFEGIAALMRNIGGPFDHGKRHVVVESANDDGLIGIAPKNLGNKVSSRIE